MIGYRIQASAGDDPAVVHIYDEIGWTGLTAQELVEQLAGISGDLIVHLSTPGGEVFDGIAIYQSLRQRRGRVTVIVDALAASIGSVIAMGASPGHLVMAKNASMMIHDAHGVAVGNAAELLAFAGLLDKASANIASIYAERAGGLAATWREAMRAETWYVGQEAVDAGLADRVQEAGQHAA